MAGKGAFRHLLYVLLFISLTQGQTPYVKEPDKNGTTIVSDNRPSTTGHRLMPGLDIKGFNDTVSPLVNATKITSDDEFTDSADLPDKAKADLLNKPQTPLRAVTVLHTPYVMKASDGDRLVGLVPDILHELGQRLHLTFDLYLVADGKYGTRDINGTWDGMMGDLVRRQSGDTSDADMAAAPMTVTSERQRVASFLEAFVHGGLTGVIRKPYLDDYMRSPLDSIYFNVMRPLSTGVWVSIILSCVVVAVGLWLLNYFNPYEWGARYNLGRATEAASESFSLPGALWFTFTTLQWQGFDRMPRSSASKTLSLFWMAFVTLTLVTYMASVMNHLFWASTRQGDLRAAPIIDLAHLASANEDLHYDYGMEFGGPTYHYLMGQARGMEYDAMRAYWINSGVDNLVGDTDAGIQRARKGKYVFITERMTAQFFVSQKPCDLMMLDKVVAPKAYAFALSKSIDKTVKEAMSTAILEMIETGDMDALHNKWFVLNDECRSETKAEEDKSALSRLFVATPKQITFTMFWGPLLILVLGIFFSGLAFVAECLYYRYKGQYQRSNRAGGQRLGTGDGEVQE